MTKRAIYSFTVILLAAVSIYAAEPITAQIPFSFHVGNSTLPSGSYTADSSAGSGSVLRLRSSDGKSAAMILSYGIPAHNGAASQPKLIFHKYGDDYFLFQVWGTGDIGRELLQSRREAELAAAARRDTRTVVAKR
jgi:hypothetical protein